MRKLSVFLTLIVFASAQESDVDKEIRRIEAEIAAKEASIQSLSNELEQGTKYKLATQPTRIEFPVQSGSEDFFVFDGAQIVPATELKSVQIAGSANVQQMFEISRGDGGYNGITITTVPGKLQAGTYAVEVVTARGKAKLTIEATFGPKQKVNVGPLRESFSIALPAKYPLGSYLDLNTDGASTTYFTWKVDGKIVLEGRGKSRLRYVLAKPGPISVSAEERINDNSVASWSGTTQVVPEQTYTHAMKKGQEFQLDTAFLGLTGFAEHVWFLNGKKIGPGTNFKMKFPQAGTYRVTCIATKPTDKYSKIGMREVTYKINVN